MKLCIADFIIKYSIKSISYLLLFFLVLGLFNSCKRENNKLRQYLAEIHKLNPRIEEQDWNIKHSYETEIEFFYDLQKKVVDTTYSLSFSFFKKNSEQNINEFYFIDQYIETYCGDSIYYELAQNITDTLYMFKHPCIEGKIYLDSLEFIMGKYYYMARHNKLSGKQMRYYKLFKDSLDEIKGNDLPELPELLVENENDTLEILEEKRID